MKDRLTQDFNSKNTFHSLKYKNRTKKVSVLTKLVCFAIAPFLAFGSFSYIKNSGNELLIDTKVDRVLEKINAISENYSMVAGNEISDDLIVQEVLQENLIEENVFSREDWRLLLVNKQHVVPDNYQINLGNINTIKGTMKCDERIINDLSELLSAAKEDGIQLGICSPYRNREYQESLFRRKVKKYMKNGMNYLQAYQTTSQVVTIPGASEHQIGLAFDFVGDDDYSLETSFENTNAGIWLKDNGYKFGFILRYPKGKEYITGIEYEPWHYRYVGVEAATIIYENQLTLEEFWEEYL